MAQILVIIGHATTYANAFSKEMKNQLVKNILLITIITLIILSSLKGPW
jgi:hypothetical protein